MTDQQAMELALREARAAADAGEVPVGAVVLQDGRVVGTGRNAPIALHDPTAHAEIVALRAAARHLGNYRLDDCELFVTLEPCAMCVGAVLQARLRRVVYGAAEPRSGAAGSVLDLFRQPRSNAHTTCTGGLLAAQSQALLHAFFAQRRQAQRVAALAAYRLRDDALRTPTQAFEKLPDYPWPPRYVADLPALAGLRLHYLDEGPADAPVTWFCTHSALGWSYQWRHLIPVWLAAGHRVVAVDLIGFGQSDKPKKDAAHTFDWHRQVVRQLIERLDLRAVVLALPDAKALLALSLPPCDPARYRGVLIAATGFGDVDATALAAPFPDRGHRAALRQFAAPGFTDVVDRQALSAFWRHRWQGRTMLAHGTQPPWTERDAIERLAHTLAGQASIESNPAPPRAIAQATVGYFTR